MSVTPKIAVTTDTCLVDGDSFVKPRRRFVGRIVDPDGLEFKGAGSEAARGDPAPMSSWVSFRDYWLSCRCIEEFSNFFNIFFCFSLCWRVYYKVLESVFCMRLRNVESKPPSHHLWKRPFSPSLLTLEGRAIAWACLFLAIGANPGKVTALFCRDALKHIAGTKIYGFRFL